MASVSNVSSQPTKIEVTSELSTKTVRTEESTLANAIVDAARNADKSDIAFMQASAFSEITIGKGGTTVDDILKAIEYREDSIIVVKLKGTQVRRALEHGLTLYPQKNSAFLQVSGITVNIDPAADKDKRVTAIKVGGSALQDDKTYTVAMPSPLASGALGYFKIWDKATAIDHDTNKTLGQAATEYLSGLKSLGAKGEERLVFKK